MSEKTNPEILKSTVQAKLAIENAGKHIAAALGNSQDKVCKVYREQGIIHLAKAIELLNVDHQSVKVIALRSLLKFDLVRTVKELKDVDRIKILSNPQWLHCFNDLDLLSASTKHTTRECLLAWSNGMDLLEPYIGAKGVKKQKQKLDSMLKPVKKKVAKKKTTKRKK